MLCVAVIMSRHRKEVGVNNYVLVRVSVVAMLMNWMEVQGWQEKSSQQQNRQEGNPPMSGAKS